MMIKTPGIKVHQGIVPDVPQKKTQNETKKSAKQPRNTRRKTKQELGWRKRGVDTMIRRRQ